MLILVHLWGKAIIQTKLFDTSCIMVILINSIVMIFDDPT